MKATAARPSPARAFRLMAVALACWGGAVAGWGGTAQAASIERGLTFARVNCAQCHSIDKLSPSPLKDAPPFRTLGQRYPIENLEEALAEGIVTSHPSMPEFRLEPDQIGDFLAFLKSLQ